MSKRFKFWLNIFTIIALAALIIFTRKKIIEVFHQIPSLNLSALLLIIPIQLGSYYATSRLYYDYLKSIDINSINQKEMYKITYEMNFINSVFPSAGVSGFSYLPIRLRHYGIKTSTSALTQVIKFVLTFISFMILLFVGMFILALSRHTSPLIILICSSISFLTLFGTFILVHIISNEQRIKSFSAFLPKIVNAIVRPLRKSNADIINIARVERLFETMHKDYIELSRDWSRLKRPLLWALAGNLAEVFTIYVVFVAFGKFINPGALIIAYAAANVSGVIAILPGNVGIYETTMTAILISAGSPGALAVSVTLVYRILNMLLFLPPGYVLYHQALKRGEAEAMSHAIVKSKHDTRGASEKE